MARFKSFADPELRARGRPQRHEYHHALDDDAGMSQSDLEAIYAYLRQVPPVRNRVTPFAPDRPRQDPAGSDRR